MLGDLRSARQRNISGSQDLIQSLYDRSQPDVSSLHSCSDCSTGVYGRLRKALPGRNLKQRARLGEKPKPKPERNKPLATDGFAPGPLQVELAVFNTRLST